MGGCYDHKGKHARLSQREMVRMVRPKEAYGAQTTPVRDGVVVQEDAERPLLGLRWRKNRTLDRRMAYRG